MNYQITVSWDPNLVYANFTGSDLSSTAGKAVAELCYEGVYLVSGAPTNTPNVYLPGAIVHNASDHINYENTGTTASPNFVAMATGSGGLNQLIGDVLAGPGSGSQVATVIGIRGIGTTPGAVSPGQMFLVNGIGAYQAATISKDLTMNGAGQATVVGLQGHTVSATSPTASQMFIFDGTFWTPQNISQDLNINISGVATVEGLKGVLLGAAVGTPVKNNLLSYNGTTWSTTPEGTVAASAGAATLNNQNGLVTSESLVTAVGATYTLVLTSSAFSATSQPVVVAYQGTSTQGLPVVTKVTPGSGTCTIVVTNALGAAFNGTILIKYLVL